MREAANICSVPPWSSPPNVLALACDEVHVWRVALDENPPQVLSFLRNLAADEQARAMRLYFERDREHFIVARGVLRAILGSYLNRAPECLSFSYSSHGKPFLTGESNKDAIRFSVSHSGGVALYAVTRGREVGIDLERIRFDFAVREIAERFFSPREVAALQALPADGQQQAFFRYWTCKEAYIKARGEGLSLPLDQFEVSLARGNPTAVLNTPRDSSEASRWSLQELNPAPGYAAALAVEGRCGRLRSLQWLDPTEQSV
jgi:4'-phosphopantetheinyl transferase